MFTTLTTAKNHLNIDNDYHADDDYILHLIRVAEDAVAKKLNVKSLSNILNRNTGGLPDSVLHSILLLVGSWYGSRETFSFQSVSKLPHSFDFLCDLNRNYKEPF